MYSRQLFLRLVVDNDGKGILNGSIYALNAPKAGCQESYDDLMYGDLFHFRKREPEYLDKWPSGKYCIYNVGKLEWSYEGNDWSYGKCPNGFEPGESSYPFVALPGGSGTTRYSPLGPYVVHSNHTRIQFCCSENDVREKSTISLPFVKPFYLLPFETKSCQAVKDTTVRLEWIQWPQLYHEYGLHPYVEEGPYGNGTMFFMCYYVPNVNKLILILTYVITIGSPTLSIAFFCWMGWCHRKRLEWSYNRNALLSFFASLTSVTARFKFEHAPCYWQSQVCLVFNLQMVSEFLAKSISLEWTIYCNPAKSSQRSSEKRSANTCKS
ncbi:hypothetical protein HOLleu_16156 [Holothuria leucospilota]|uniref:Apextrin C-terminal domain-containing protein n=1 Tax=Holothuria leucospilota TaxID=206669 RepID=A0A9Q1HA67_HOLLE|nr:hypothetical protein HOLleu_16156 [Holothuria leucospilota]